MAGTMREVRKRPMGDKRGEERNVANEESPCWRKEASDSLGPKRCSISGLLRMSRSEASHSARKVASEGLKGETWRSQKEMGRVNQGQESTTGGTKNEIEEVVEGEEEDEIRADEVDEEGGLISS